MKNKWTEEEIRKTLLTMLSEALNLKHGELINPDDVINNDKVEDFLQMNNDSLQSALFDSLEMAALILNIEETFDIQIDEKDYGEILTLNKIVEFVKNKL